MDNIEELEKTIFRRSDSIKLNIKNGSGKIGLDDVKLYECKIVNPNDLLSVKITREKLSMGEPICEEFEE